MTATNALIEGDMRREDRRHNVDKVAAAVILQQWLDTRRNQMNEQKTEDKKMDENIIELIDDETGETVQFAHLATVEYEGKLYIALADADDVDGECEVFLLEIVTDEEGNESYEQIESEEEQEAVFQAFLQLMEEEDDE